MSRASAASASLPALGVGVTYSSAVEPLLGSHPHLFDLVEVEPQTVWLKTADPRQPYRVEAAVLEHLAALPGRKLVHSVGTPVGGTVRPEPAQLQLLRHTVERLGSPWVSDHLSFNATPEFATGFFLPPRQTPEGVDTVVASVRDFQAALSVPVAVETGVNYLRPRPDELPDGAFVAHVVERADCGLLLDLHNAFANSLNGRQPLEAFLASLPLERVWELHVAGGMELDGFWLDAHSGAIPDALYEAARRLVPRLPNLKAIVFEVFPSFVPVVGLDLVREQVERLRELWALRLPPGEPPPPTVPRRNPSPDPAAHKGVPTPAAWEHALGGLVVGRPAGDELGRELAQDRGVALVEGLVHEFRASMVVGVLRLTSRLLMLALGPDVFRALLADFWSKTPPQPFASLEAEAFAAHLEGLGLPLPQLSSLLAFERAVTATLTDGLPRVAAFDADPLPLLRALAEGRLPSEPGQPGRFEIEVTPDGPAGALGLDPAAVRLAFPFH